MKAALVFVFCCFISISGEPTAKKRPIDHCNLYGSFFETKIKAEADIIVYVEESEAFADMVVFKEENKLLADRPGAWHFTDQKGFADYFIYFEKSTSKADFSIYYTDVASFIGCK